MSAYVIARVNASSWSWLKEYGKPTRDLIEKYGGRYVAQGGKTTALEGSEALPNAYTIIEFPDIDSARAWYEDPDYQPLKKIRNDSADTELTLVEGL